MQRHCDKIPVLRVWRNFAIFARKIAYAWLDKAPMMNISALVLAAGRSSRMPGCNKLLLPLRGKPIIAHVVDHLLQTRVSEIIVIVGHEAEQVQAALPQRPVRFAINNNYAHGMSTSIIAGVQAISQQSRALLIALGDQPFITAADINLIITSPARAPHATIVVPEFRGRRGHPVLFDVRHCNAMLQLAGDVGCKSIIQQNANEVLEVEMPNDHILRDVDTLKAYAALKPV